MNTKYFSFTFLKVLFGLLLLNCSGCLENVEKNTKKKFSQINSELKNSIFEYSNNYTNEYNNSLQKVDSLSSQKSILNQAVINTQNYLDSLTSLLDINDPNKVDIDYIHEIFVRRACGDSAYIKVKRLTDYAKAATNSLNHKSLIQNIADSMFVRNDLAKTVNLFFGSTNSTGAFFVINSLQEEAYRIGCLGVQ